jgi:hypothetical protein
MFPPGTPPYGGCFPNDEGTAVSDMQGNPNGPTLDDCKASCDAVAECRAFALTGSPSVATCYFKARLTLSQLHPVHLPVYQSSTHPPPPPTLPPAARGLL